MHHPQQLRIELEARSKAVDLQLLGGHYGPSVTNASEVNWSYE